MTDAATSLATALVAFQSQVPTIPKNRTAKIPMKGGGSYSYKYADLSDVWAGIRPVLARNGLAVTQPLTAASPGCMGIKTKIWHGPSDQVDESVIEFPVEGKSQQEDGSAVTYFKRYALASALGLDIDDDDDGSRATHREPAAPAKAPAPKPKAPADVARGELRKLAADNRIDLNRLAARFIDDYGLSIADADAETIRGFMGIVADEIAVDKAAG